METHLEKHELSPQSTNFIAGLITKNGPSSESSQLLKFIASLEAAFSDDFAALQSLLLAVY